MAIKTRRMISVVIFTVMLAALAGCSGSPVATPNDTFPAAVPTPVLQTHSGGSITISVPLYKQSDPFQKRREELFSKCGVQVQFAYETNCQTDNDVITRAVVSVNAGKDVDAYMLPSWQVDTYAAQYKTPDLTQDIAQNAMELKKFYDEQGIVGPFYGLPISYEYAPFGRYGIAVSKKLVDKYNPSIETIQDYFNFLQLIREKEPEYTPGAIDYSWGTDTLMTVSGYVDANNFLQVNFGFLGLYLKPDDPLNTLAYAEDIPQVVAAVKNIRQLQEDKTLISMDNISRAKIATLAMGLSQSGISIYNTPETSQVWDMVLFPVERQLMSSTLCNQIYGSLVLSPNTQKKDDVLRFVSALMTNSANYQLAQYGEQGSEYNLEGSRISPVSKNSYHYSDFGISSWLRIPAYCRPTVTQPLNALEAISAKGLSDDCVSKFIRKNPREFSKQKDDFEAKLTGDFESFTSGRKQIFTDILYGSGKAADVDEEMKRLKKDPGLLELYKDFIGKMMEK